MTMVKYHRDLQTEPNLCPLELSYQGSRFKVQGSLLFVTYTIIKSIISSEMQVELKKNTA